MVSGGFGSNDERWLKVFTPVKLEVSAQIIGEPTRSVWCSTCNLPSAEIDAESYEIDPVVNLLTLWGFELPDSPSLIDNRD